MTFKTSTNVLLHLKCALSYGTWSFAYDQGRQSAVKTKDNQCPFRGFETFWLTIRKMRLVDNVSRLRGKKINPCHGTVALVRTAPLLMIRVSHCHVDVTFISDFSTEVYMQISHGLLMRKVDLQSFFMVTLDDQGLMI